MKRCPKCGSSWGKCSECGKVYPHGTAARCTNTDCVKLNAPIDCQCGFVVSNDLKGVLDFDLNLLPWM